MRPTFIEFRSPHQKTPDPGLPRVTYDGRNLEFVPSKGDCRWSSFSNEKRFASYENQAKKTGYRVGPGSYSPENLTIGREKVNGGCLYKAFHGGARVENNGYYFVGNNLVFESKFVMKNQHKPRHQFKDLAFQYKLVQSAERPKSSAASVRTDSTRQALYSGGQDQKNRGSPPLPGEKKAAYQKMKKSSLSFKDY